MAADAESGGGDDFADEGSWYAALVAGEHVGNWLDAVRDTSKPAHRRAAAARSLAAKVRSDVIYAAEAGQAKALEVLHAVAASDQGDDALRTALALALDACAAAAASDQHRTVMHNLGGGVHVSVTETSLDHGVGAKLWRAAVLLSREIAAAPHAVAGARILELGAGVGLVGLTAAKCGAAAVVLSDFETPLLDALHASVRRNNLEHVARVVRLDWREELDGSDAAADAFASLHLGGGRHGDAAASLAPDETFDIVLGSDVLYESIHATALPHAVHRRLRKGGTCRLLGAVRDRAMLNLLVRRCAELGLCVRESPVTVRWRNDARTPRARPIAVLEYRTVSFKRLIVSLSVVMRAGITG